MVSIQNSIRICVYYVATINSKGQKKILWHSCTLLKFLSDILPFYNPILHALLSELFRSDQVRIPSEMISSTEAELTLTPSAAQVTMPSCKYQLTENRKINLILYFFLKKFCQKHNDLHRTSWPCFCFLCHFHLAYLNVVEFPVSLWPPLVSASSMEEEKCWQWKSKNCVWQARPWRFLCHSSPLNF